MFKMSRKYFFLVSLGTWKRSSNYQRVSQILNISHQGFFFIKIEKNAHLIQSQYDSGEEAHLGSRAQSGQIDWILDLFYINQFVA